MTKYVAMLHMAKWQDGHD